MRYRAYKLMKFYVRLMQQKVTNQMAYAKLDFLLRLH